MEYRLLLAALMGVVGAYTVLRYEAGRTNSKDATPEIADLLLFAGCIGLLGGRLAAMIGGGTNPFTRPGDIIVFRAGVETGYAALFALAAFMCSTRKELWAASDAAAPAALGGLGAWHLSCLIRDSCLGSASGLPWTFSSGGSDVTRHPVGLYTALLFAAAAAGLVWWKRRRRPLGAVGGAALAAAGAVRLLTEPLRLGIGRGPELWYAAALAVGGALTVWRLRLGVYAVAVEEGEDAADQKDADDPGAAGRGPFARLSRRWTRRLIPS
jgi:prolipoprotein diacylglyceryltransferase